MSAGDETPAVKSAIGEAASEGARRSWHAPVIKVFPAAEAETGVNSTTDENATFS